jgi:hypothetical protein
VKHNEKDRNSVAKVKRDRELEIERDKKDDAETDEEIETVYRKRRMVEKPNAEPGIVWRKTEEIRNRTG